MGRLQGTMTKPGCTQPARRRNTVFYKQRAVWASHWTLLWPSPAWQEGIRPATLPIPTGLEDPGALEDGAKPTSVPGARAPCQSCQVLPAQVKAGAVSSLHTPTQPSSRCTLGRLLWAAPGEGGGWYRVSSLGRSVSSPLPAPEQPHCRLPQPLTHTALSALPR